MLHHFFLQSKLDLLPHAYRCNYGTNKLNGYATRINPKRQNTRRLSWWLMSLAVFSAHQINNTNLRTNTNSPLYERNRTGHESNSKGTIVERTIYLTHPKSHMLIKAYRHAAGIYNKRHLSWLQSRSPRFICWLFSSSDGWYRLDYQHSTL